VVSGHGTMATEVGRLLQAAGAHTGLGTLFDAAGKGAICLFCPDGPAIEALEDLNRAALESGAQWMPAFPFGDSIVVGPVMRPGNGPCFRCFERRWLGLSPSIALERAYLDFLRRGGWQDEQLAAAEIERLAESTVAIIADYVPTANADNRIAVIHRETIEVSEGYVVRSPWCEACAAHGGHLHDTGRAEAASLEAQWVEPPKAFAEFAGKVRTLSKWPCGFAALASPPKGRATLDDPRLLKLAVARFALPEPESVDGKQNNWSHGAADTADTAEILAITEAIERYAGLSPMPADITASYAAVAADALLPTTLPLFSPAQYQAPNFPFQPFDPQRPLNWTRGRNFTQGKPILVPTAAAWYGKDDELLAETSSGVAAHSSRGLALLNGALELIERDAFMIHWLNKLSPPLVELDQIEDAGCRARIEHVERIGHQVRVAELTTDLGIATFLAVGFRDDRRAPALVIGAAADLDPAVAMARALKELFSATLMPTPLWKLGPALDAAEVVTLDDHSSAYQHPSWLPRASFLWSSERRVAPPRSSERVATPDSGIAALRALTARLARHGHDLIGVDLTPADIAAHEIRVVRAIIPGLQPLGFGDRIRLGGQRLYYAPVAMRHRAVPLGEADLYRVPHCFP
jgi:ribosomal protein S12 methylthiotransferase accessory factor